MQCSHSHPLSVLDLLLAQQVSSCFWGSLGDQVGPKSKLGKVSFISPRSREAL